MSTVNIPKQLRKAFTTNAYIRNGVVPNAHPHSVLQEDANKIIRWRSKAVCSFARPISGIGTSVVWRAKYRSSTHVDNIWVRFIIAQAKLDGANANPYGGLIVYDPGAAAIVGSTTFAFGNDPTSGGADLPSQFGIGLTPAMLSGAVATIPADTNLEINVSGYDSARLVGCTVYEVSKASDTANGYAGGAINGGSPIFDNHRGDIIPPLRNRWKNGTPLFNWSSHTDATAPTNTSNATAANIIDAATTVSAATPGWTLDLTNRSTVRRAALGVPCRMHVYAKVASVGAVTDNVRLVNSSGTTLASVDVTSTTAAWYTSAAFYLPATVAKYDVHSISDVLTQAITVYAVSVEAYEA